MKKEPEFWNAVYFAVKIQWVYYMISIRPSSFVYYLFPTDWFPERGGGYEALPPPQHCPAVGGVHQRGTLYGCNGVPPVW